MRKAILALVVVGMFIGASGVALAGSELWSILDAHGETWYKTSTVHGGADWQRVGDVSTGTWITPTQNVAHFWLNEEVNNVGNINLARYVNAPVEWDLQETKEIWADGETTICKDLLWKTNTRSVFEGTTELECPTIMNIDVVYSDPTPTYDHEALQVITNDGSNVGNDPNTNSNWGHYMKITDSDMDMYYHQAIGDNMDPLCEIPMPPTCEGHFWCIQ